MNKATSLEGSLAGIEVQDLSPAGKKYRDVLTMGRGEGREKERVGVERGREGCDEKPQSLCFSVHISPQVSGWGCSHSNDVHVTVAVPTIHYTHSVNLVYELEQFVSEFQQLTKSVLQSFSSAAVVMAKGLVNEKNQLAEQLSTSLGPRTVGFPTTLPPGGLEFDTVDAPLIPPHSRDHLYLNISVQSPVIILPSSPQSDKCLIAYLGEISVGNRFEAESLVDSVSLSMSLSANFRDEKEVLSLKIDNMSLHATHDVQSRALLVANNGSDVSLSCSGQWWKILQETSVVVQIERKLDRGRAGEGERGREGWTEGEDEGGKEREGEVGENNEGGRQLSDRGENAVGLERLTVGGVSHGGVSDNESKRKGTPKLLVDGTSSDGAPSADVTVTGRICDPLLLRLPKEVFDQIRVTLKHGLHRSAPRKKKKKGDTFSFSPPSSSDSGGKGSSSNSATSSHIPTKPDTSLSSESLGVSPLTIAASFFLPRLSLELKHTIGSQERDLVYISFEEFSATCCKTDPHLASVNLTLRSIIIEDLLQEKKSEYRYILASSTKSDPSPLRSRSGSSPQGLSLSPSHLSPLTLPLLSLTHLMSSTPRQPQAAANTDSPLRSFSPHSTGTSQTRLKPDLTSDSQDTHHVAHGHSETCFSTPKTSFKRLYPTSRASTLTSSRVGASSSATSLTSHNARFDSNEHEETGSTLQEDAGCHYSSHHGNYMGDTVGLLSIKAMLVDKDCLEFETKYNSVSGYNDVLYSLSLTHSLSPFLLTSLSLSPFLCLPTSLLLPLSSHRYQAT